MAYEKEQSNLAVQKKLDGLKTVLSFQDDQVDQKFISSLEEQITQLEKEMGASGIQLGQMQEFTEGHLEKDIE